MSSLLAQLTVIVVLMPAFLLAQTNIIACPGIAPPSALRIPGCTNSPCHINSGDAFSYEMDFSATHATAGLSLVVNATVLGLEREVSLPAGMENACISLTSGSCPVTTGQQLTQRAAFPVFNEYHGGIPGQLRIQIDHNHGTHGHACVCTLINVIVH